MAGAPLHVFEGTCPKGHTIRFSMPTNNPDRVTGYACPVKNSRRKPCGVEVTTVKHEGPAPR